MYSLATYASAHAPSLLSFLGEAAAFYVYVSAYSAAAAAAFDFPSRVTCNTTYMSI